MPNISNYSKLLLIVVVYLFCIYHQTFSQCAVRTGPSPPGHTFNTGINTIGEPLPPSAKDLRWKVARDSVNGTYNAAIVMSTVPPAYYVSAWRDCAWISFSQTGEHTGDSHFFYKTDFDLPCFNPCGSSYDSDSSFCLALDLFADNSIYEIFVNGIPQSSNLNNIIPLANPFNYSGHKYDGKLSVILCNNWRAGNNTLIIQTASSATINGLLVQAPTIPTPPVSDTIDATICEGDIYTFNDQELSLPGYYTATFHPAPDCDSAVTLHLYVTAKTITINHSICDGEIYQGYSATGVYRDAFVSASGCDSIRILKLTVEKKPRPELSLVTEICDGDSLVLKPGTFLWYKWQDGSTSDHYVVTTPGLYSVSVANTCGATRHEMTVNQKECFVSFPNAFTPNNDGRNDQFKIATPSQLSEFSLTVYNRWGQKVFESTDPAVGWDGRVSNRLQPAGTFVWLCKYKRDGISSVTKGTVTMIRE